MIMSVFVQRPHNKDFVIEGCFLFIQEVDIDKY